MTKFQDIFHYHQNEDDDGNSADIRIVYDPSNKTFRLYMAEMINNDLDATTCVIPDHVFRELKSKL